MTEFILRTTRAADAAAVAELANQYTFQNLTEPERAGGFLTGSFTAPGLAAMLASAPGQLAYHGQELAGFIVNSHLPADQYPPFIQEIVDLLPTLRYQQRALTEYRWLFYGPVVVGAAYRGQGLLQQLFQANQRALAGRFELGIAFIATVNAASMHVHTQKLGLTVVGHLTFLGVEYALLAFAIAPH